MQKQRGSGSVISACPSQGRDYIAAENIVTGDTGPANFEMGRVADERLCSGTGHFDRAADWRAIRAFGRRPRRHRQSRARAVHPRRRRRRQRRARRVGRKSKGPDPKPVQRRQGIS
jgi:hypothetical protein